jgi:hypothetical protein
MVKYNMYVKIRYQRMKMEPKNLILVKRGEIIERYFLKLPFKVNGPYTGITKNALKRVNNYVNLVRLKNYKIV